VNLAQDDDPGQTNRVAEKLLTLTTFDRTQVAWLMAQAFRCGYELRDEEDRGFQAGYNARVAEENAAYPPAAYFIAKEHFYDLDRMAYREECDAPARLPRPGDFRGVREREQVAA
jgi:hypothetical protein